jgi:hypothetical protein
VGAGGLVLRPREALRPHEIQEERSALLGVDVEERYVLGPAVDEAAGAMDRPEGAFVYLTPSARDVFAYKGQPPVAARWRVPLKPARRGDPLEEYDTWVASPFAHDAGGASTTWDVADLLLKTFDRGLADDTIRRKRDNTEAFLRRAHEEHQAAMSRPSARDN